MACLGMACLGMATKQTFVYHTDDTVCMHMYIYIDNASLCCVSDFQY